MFHTMTGLPANHRIISDYKENLKYLGISNKTLRTLIQVENRKKLKNVPNYPLPIPLDYN